MRLQLTLVLSFCIFICSAQTDLEPIEIDFLASYYEQDGIHSAVTGGEGTEELEDKDFQIVVNIPVDTINSIHFSVGVNHYTTASTDQIDTDVSSASSEDVRTQYYIGYSRKLKNDQTLDLTFGGSQESDYHSVWLKAGWSKSYQNGNQLLSLSAQAFFDQWVIIIPEELRATNALLPGTDIRNSYNFSGSYNWVLGKRVQAAISADVVYQAGLLSTPFHRVYLQGEDLARIERLPDERFKFPIGLRFNWFASDFLVIRTFNRYYADDFGIRANSHSIELRFKAGNFLTLFPHYRYHNQSEARYFNPIDQGDPTRDFYTSDFDLSDLESHLVGGGLHWSPLNGLARFKFFSKRKQTWLKEVHFRYSYYYRSDGLDANMLSFGLGIEVSETN